MLELTPHGISVNVVVPSPILADYARGIVETDSEQEDVLAKRVPVGRIGEVADLTNVILFFCDATSRFITGQAFYACGGANIGILTIWFLCRDLAQQQWPKRR